MRKRGHGCHAPRVKPTINREVKSLRCLVGPSFVGFRSKIAPPVPLPRCTAPMEIYIYIEAEFLFFLSIKILSLSFTNLPRASPSKGRRGRRRKTNRIEFHPRQKPRCGQCINASKRDKARFRSRALVVSRIHDRCSATIVETRKENEEKGEVHKVIRSLFIDSRHCTRIVMDGWMCFISSHATLLPSSTSLRGKKGGRGEGTEQEKWRAEGEKSRGGTR